MDPTEVYGCECVRCLNWQHDSWEDVDENGVCYECQEEIENEDDA